MLRFPWSGRSQKSRSFTDEQIQSKVYELWKARGFAGSSPEEDRLKAIALLEESAPPFGKKHRLNNWGSKDDREFALKVKQFHWERFKTVISAFGLAATIFAGVGLYLTYQNAQEEKQLNIERLITDRFSKSVEQLGSKEISVRIGGIYALERIAKDSPKDHWTVMEVLTAFVRERSPNRQLSPEPFKRPSPNGKETELPGIPTDVQSVLTAITRRDASKETDEQRLKLSETYLVKALLVSANLQEAIFYGANLQGANISRANLQRAVLRGANLQGAVLDRANLQGAVLDGANLQEVYLPGANLQGAIISRANLQGARRLDSANLQGAILIATDLRNAEKLTQPQLAGVDPPLLCNVALPKEIKVNPNRDCDRLPQELVKRYPELFSTPEFAKGLVDEGRKQQW
jgi:hypothetical protein